MDETEPTDARFPPLPPVFEIATGLKTPLIAAVDAPEQSVSIWELGTSQMVARFSSFWDVGGRRLAISEDGQRCCVGAFVRHGISMHKSTTGERVWQRKDLKKIQNLRFSLHSDTIFAGIDQRGLRVLQGSDGTDLETIRGVVDLWENPFGQQVFLKKESGPHKLLDFQSRETLATIKPSGSWVSDVCFSEEALAISDGPTDLYSVKDGALIWRYLDPDYRNSALAYCEQTHEIVAINVRRERKTGGESIVTFDIETGKITRRLPRDDLRLASLAWGGTRVITWYGDVIDTHSGEVVSRIDFRQKNTAS